MIKRFRLSKVARLVIGILLTSALIAGGVVYGRRSASNGYACLAVLDSSGKPVELLEVLSGARYTFRRKIVPWVDLTLQRTSPDGKYVAHLQSTGSRQYTLIIKEPATDTITATQPNIVTAPDHADYGYHDIVWSPDSTRLALVWSHRPPQERFISTLKIDGTDFQRRDNVTFLHGWSADGQNLAVSLGTGAQGFNRPLYLWSLSGAKLTVVSRSGYEPIAAVWSPTGTQLAFVERPSGNLQGAAWLGIASTTKASVTRLALPSAVQQARARLVWSPNGRYLAVIYDAQGASMLSVMDVEKGTTVLQTPAHDTQTMLIPQLWLENSRVFTFVRANSNSTIDWVKYYLDENRYETVVLNIQEIVRADSLYSGKVAVRYAHNGMQNVDLTSADGTNRIPFIENASEVEVFPWSPDGKAIMALWTPHLQRQTHLTWMTTGTNRFTLVDNFVAVPRSSRWLEGSKALVIREIGQTEATIWLVNLANGSQQILYKGLSAPASKFVEIDPHVVGFQWQDDNGMQWIDGYNAEGNRIYHFQAIGDVESPIHLSPDRQLAALSARQRNQSYTHDLLISSADGQQLQILRTRLNSLQNIQWSPDGKLIGFWGFASNGAPILEVLRPDGSSQQIFDAYGMQGSFRWARCDSYE
jgi:Tol biopolymer transport system component